MKGKNSQTTAPDINSDWLTRRQAARYLQVGISTLDTRIPVKKYYLGKSVRYYKPELDELLFFHCEEPSKGGKK